MKSSDKLKSKSRKVESHKPVAVLKNLLTQQETESIADKWVEQKSLRMSLAETLAHAAQLQKEQLATE